MKRVIICLTYLVLVVCAMAAMTGCGSGSMERNKKAARLLEEKYGEKFVIDEYRGREPMQDYYTVIAHSEEYPAVIFSAGIGDDGSVSDTYVCERLMARMSDEMGRSMGSLKGGRYIFMQALTPYTTIKDPDVSFEEFMAEAPKQEFVVYVNYAPEKDETAEEIFGGLSEMLAPIDSAQGYVAVYICNNKTLGEVQKYVESHDILYDSYDKLVEDRFAGLIRYEKGALLGSESDFVKKAGSLL